MSLCVCVCVLYFFHTKFVNNSFKALSVQTIGLLQRRYFFPLSRSLSLFCTYVASNVSGVHRCCCCCCSCCTETACVLSFPPHRARRSPHTPPRWRDELGRYSNYRATPLQRAFAVIDLRRVYRVRRLYTVRAKTGFVARGGYRYPTSGAVLGSFKKKKIIIQTRRWRGWGGGRGGEAGVSAG